MSIKQKLNFKAYPDMNVFEKIIYKIKIKIFLIKNKKYIKEDVQFSKFR